MVELGIEPGTSWLVVRSSDHQAMRMVHLKNHIFLQLRQVILTNVKKHLKFQVITYLEPATISLNMPSVSCAQTYHPILDHISGSRKYQYTYRFDVLNHVVKTELEAHRFQAW